MVAMIFVGLGVGSVKATFFPFLGSDIQNITLGRRLIFFRTGDQYVQKVPQLVRQNNGNWVIVDGPRTLQFMYNAYYWQVSFSPSRLQILQFLHKSWQSLRGGF